MGARFPRLTSRHRAGTAQPASPDRDTPTHRIASGICGRRKLGPAEPGLALRWLPLGLSPQQQSSPSDLLSAP